MSETKASNLTRRNFIKLSLLGTGGIAAGLYGISNAGKVDYSDPAYLYWNKNSRGALDLESYLVLCASLAPSAHNTQPWKFTVTPGKIGVYADLKRNLGQADKDRRMMLMSLGCAIENIAVAASQFGLYADIAASDANTAFSSSGLCAEITLVPGKEAARQNRFDAIFKRQTTRTVYIDEPVDTSLITSIAAVNDFPALSLHWFDQPDQRPALSRLHKDAVRSYVNDDPAYLDSLDWWRYSRDEILEKRDGISIFTSGAPNLIKQYFQYSVDREDMAGDFGKNGEVDLMDKLFDATPLWGAITSSYSSNISRLTGGRLLERVYLEVAHQNYRIMPIAYIPEQENHAAEFKRAFNIPEEHELLSIFRIGKSDLCEKSVRRPLKEILV